VPAARLLAADRRRRGDGVQAGGDHAGPGTVVVRVLGPVAFDDSDADADAFAVRLSFAVGLAAAMGGSGGNPGGSDADGVLAVVAPVLVRHPEPPSMSRRLTILHGGPPARQRGLAKGALIALVALGGVVIAVGLALRAILSAPPAPQVTLSAASAASAQSKVQSFNQAGQQAAQRRQPITVVQTFSDSELSSYANQQAAAHGLPFGNIRLHATSGGSIEGAATVRVAGASVPIALNVIPQITADNRLQVHLSQVALGSLALPGPLADQINRSLSQSLDLAALPAGLRDVRLRVTDGQITISGVAQPSS